MIGKKVGETTARRGGETPIKMGEETWIEIVEEIPVMRLVGETTVQREGAEGTIVQGRDKTGGEKEVGETTPLRRVGGTLVKIGEGIARGPMVMEGPQQASPWPGYTPIQVHPIEGKCQVHPREGK